MRNNHILLSIGKQSDMGEVNLDAPASEAFATP
jgi:hypothetical protein